jgi:hypothetical protein
MAQLDDGNLKLNIMYDKSKIKLLQQHYQSLAEQLLALLRSDLLTEGSQERHEALMFYDRWLAKSKVLLLVLNEGIEERSEIEP